MKKLNILLLSVVAMGSTFVSCTKEDVNAVDNEKEIEIPLNISLTGKWNFSTVSEGNGLATNYSAGWGEPKTQCAGVPDYIYFKNSSTVEYGDNDTKNTADCTLTEIPMSYSTTESAVLIKNLLGSGQNVTFDVIKNTTTEMQLKVIVQGKSYTYFLTKA